MVSHNTTSGVTVTAITYYVEGSSGNRYAVGVDPVDGVTRCTCRAGQFGRDCKHQRAVREQVTAAREQMTRQTSAAWWIDRCSDSAQTILRALIQD